MSVVAPTKRYFMHFRAVVNVLEPVDAPIAEHTMSVLSGSYKIWVRVNCTVAGGGSMYNDAKNSTAMT